MDFFQIVHRASCRKKVTLMTFNEYKITFSRYGYELVSTEKGVLVLLTYVGGSCRAWNYLHECCFCTMDGWTNWKKSTLRWQQQSNILGTVLKSNQMCSANLGLQTASYYNVVKFYGMYGHHMIFKPIKNLTTTRISTHLGSIHYLLYTPLAFL